MRSQQRKIPVLPLINKADRARMPGNRAAGARRVRADPSAGRLGKGPAPASRMVIEAVIRQMPEDYESVTGGAGQRRRRVLLVMPQDIHRRPRDA